MAAVTTRITRPRLTVVPDLPVVVPSGPSPRLLPTDTAPRRRFAPSQKAVELPRVSRRIVIGSQGEVGLSVADRRTLACIVLAAGYCLLRLIF